MNGSVFEIDNISEFDRRFGLDCVCFLECLGSPFRVVRPIVLETRLLTDILLSLNFCFAINALESGFTSSGCMYTNSSFLKSLRRTSSLKLISPSSSWFGRILPAISLTSTTQMKSGLIISKFCISNCHVLESVLGRSLIFFRFLISTDSQSFFLLTQYVIYSLPHLLLCLLYGSVLSHKHPPGVVLESGHCPGNSLKQPGGYSEHHQKYNF